MLNPWVSCNCAGPWHQEQGLNLTLHRQAFRICSARIIKDYVSRLQHQALMQSLQKSVDNIENGDAVAGTFLRFARRTIVREGDGEDQAGTLRSTMEDVPSSRPAAP
jgi:hypothetical protein